MNETQRAAAERLAPMLADFANARAPSAAGFAVAEAAALLRELAAGPVVNPQMTTEPVQEPVALMWQDEETGRVTFTTMADPYVGKRWHRIPLYAAPQQRKPPGDEFVSRVVRSVQPNLDVRCKAWAEQFDECKHWLDAAYGITGEQK